MTAKCHSEGSHIEDPIFSKYVGVCNAMAAAAGAFAGGFGAIGTTKNKLDCTGVLETKSQPWPGAMMLKQY